MPRPSIWPAVLAGFGGKDAAQAVSAALLVSGIYDERIGVEAVEQRPALPHPVHDVPVHLMVGGNEPQAVLAQSVALAENWQPVLTDLTIEKLPGRDHFDVLDELASRV